VHFIIKDPPVVFITFTYHNKPFNLSIFFQMLIVLTQCMKMLIIKGLKANFHFVSISHNETGKLKESLTFLLYYILSISDDHERLKIKLSPQHFS